MLHHNTYLRSLLAIGLVIVMVNPMAAAPIDAYGGYISDDQIFEGDTVAFSGTFHNFLDQDVAVQSMNVSFVERLGINANRDPEKPNISRVYDSTRQTVPSNASLTDTLVEKIEFEPGSYNVSIFFVYTNDTATNNFGTVYAMINQTFLIEGTTDTEQTIRTIGIIIGVLVGVVIGLLVYNAKFSSKY